jgi:hypothetical protein
MLALWLAACLALPACTLIGSGVGLGVVLIAPGPYETRQSSAPTGMTRERFSAQVNPSKGDRIRLTLTGGRLLAGEYGGFVPVEAQTLRRRDAEQARVAESRATEIWVLTPEKQRVSLSEVVAAEVEAEVVGYNWLIGTAIGAAVDVYLLLLISALSGTPL